MQHAEIVMLQELHEGSIIRSSSPQSIPTFSHCTVRVTGSIGGIDVTNRFCQLLHGNFDVIVDLTIVDCSFKDFKVDAICQFIGQLVTGSERVFPGYDEAPPPFYLSGRLLRIVNDLDIDLYEQALIKRRLFLRHISDNPS
jgi:hypothetical protein